MAKVEIYKHSYIYNLYNHLLKIVSFTAALKCLYKIDGFYLKPENTKSKNAGYMFIGSIYYFCLTILARLPSRNSLSGNIFETPCI